MNDQGKASFSASISCAPEIFFLPRKYSNVSLKETPQLRTDQMYSHSFIYNFSLTDVLSQIFVEFQIVTPTRIRSVVVQ